MVKVSRRGGFSDRQGIKSENTEIQIPLTKITQRELVKIVEDFIKDFKKSIL